ncbi:MAG: hypothetical protein JW881_07245 [Spirochaetales bacterium]|nr:hypothetical protein [Spirochaetales bacterium]
MLVKTTHEKIVFLRQIFSDFLDGNISRIKDFIREYNEKQNDFSILYHLSIIFEDYLKNKKQPYGLVTSGYVIISSHPVDVKWNEDFIQYYTRVKNWLIEQFGYTDDMFNFVIVHIDRNYSFVPRTYLYKDSNAARIGLYSLEVKKEYIIHEIVHALSFIRDRFSSELLCYYAELTGLGIKETYYNDNNKNLDVSTTDVLIYNREELPDMYNIFYGYKQGEAVEIQNITLLPFYLAYLYNFLVKKAGHNRIIGFIKEIDSYKSTNEKMDFFFQQFNIKLKDIGMTIKMELIELKNNQRVVPKEKDDIKHVYQALIENEFNQLIYLKTFLKKFSSEDDIRYRIMWANIDFKMYKSYKMCGEINKELLRQIYRTIRSITEEDDTQYDAWILLYHVITEYIIINYKFNIKEDLSRLKRVEQNLLDEVKYVLDKIETLDSGNIQTKIVYGNFNLFYPFFLGANAKKGISYLEAALEMDNKNKDVYFSLIFYYDLKKNKKKVNEWISKYNNNFEDTLQYETIKQIAQQYLSKERFYE